MLHVGRFRTRVVAVTLAFGVLGSMTAIASAAPAAGFVRTGSLSTVRAYHTATLLNDGRVLITGGSNDRTVVATAELYDPATGTFTRTGSMLHARERHTATLLPDGRVLIAGGIGPKFTIDSSGRASGIYSSAELYDPATGRFRATGSMQHPRYDFHAIPLTSGLVLVLGGYAKTAELYNPRTGTFRATGSMTIDRSDFVAAALPSGKVLVAGGTNVSCVTSGTGCPYMTALAETYNPVTGTFVKARSLRTVRLDASASLLRTGRILVAGGQSSTTSVVATAELFDPASGTFRATGSMARARYLQTSTVLADGRVLIVGGVDKSALSLRTAEVYDATAGTFRPAGSMSTARTAHTATLLTDGRVLITGGNGSAGPLITAELWHA
jgi:hypothetical protein